MEFKVTRIRDANTDDLGAKFITVVLDDALYMGYYVVPEKNNLSIRIPKRVYFIDRELELKIRDEVRRAYFSGAHYFKGKEDESI